MLRHLEIFILMALAAFTTGCATVRPSGTEQVILVRSEPPGATIFFKGRSVGQTPKYIAIDRAREMSIEIASSKGPIRVPLKTEYRWTQSLVPNLVFLTFAPVGWLIDLASGAAWEAKSPPSLPLKLAPTDLEASRLPKPKEVIAIAPPSAELMSLSDTGGHAVETELIRRKVDPESFEKTLPTFLAQGYDFDGAPDPDDRASLYYSLGVSKIYESVVVPQNDQFVLQARERDVYTGNLHSAFQLNLEPSRSIDRMFTKRTWWSRLLPNTLAVDFVNTRIQLSRGDRTYDLGNAEASSWWVSAMRYLGALNITSLPPRRYGRSARWTFSLVPVLRVSRREVTAAGLPVTDPSQSSEERFTRWLLSGGYGPEVGWQVSRHYLYINIVPVAYWSEISWDTTAGMSHSITNTGLEFASEIGYILYFSKNWHAKLFTRSQMEDSAGWSEALNNRLPNSSEPTRASLLVSGLSLGYRFEPDAKPRER